jgi:hypothetical protein
MDVCMTQAQVFWRALLLPHPAVDSAASFQGLALITSVVLSNVAFVLMHVVNARICNMVCFSTACGARVPPSWRQQHYFMCFRYVHICLYIYIYIYIFIYIYTHTHVHTYAHTRIQTHFVFWYACLQLHDIQHCMFPHKTYCACSSVDVCIIIWHVCKCVYIDMYMCVCVCVYIYIYIYMYMHIYIYIHTYACMSAETYVHKSTYIQAHTYNLHICMPSTPGCAACYVCANVVGRFLCAGQHYDILFVFIYA